MQHRNQDASKNHKHLIVWQKALTLASEIHTISKAFPRAELYGLTAQLRRAAVSIPSNIAEGAARHSTREFIHFLYIARGSLAEVETQLYLAQSAGYLEDLRPMEESMDHVGRLINALIRGLRRRLDAAARMQK